MSDFLNMAQSALLDRIGDVSFDKTISLRIEDIGNLLISGQAVEISDEHAECAIFASETTLTEIMNGDLNPMKAVMFGKLKVKGDAASAMKFGNLFS